MPLCNYCGRPVWGNYISAMGTTWHPEHFLCAGCGRPLKDAEFQIAEGKPYHMACYMNYKAPRCVYCHKPLPGTYLIGPWGDKYCPEHEEQYPHCSFCSRLIPPQQQTPGWDAYGSSRCPVCRSTAIDAIEQGQPLFQQCKQWIGQQGFRFNQLPLRLDLWDRATLISRLQDRGINHPLGVTLSSRQTRNGYLISSNIEGVAVLQGMPATLFAGVVLHELGHVWLTVHRIETLPGWAEEGFCQLLSHRYYSDLNTPEARHYAQGLEQQRDPVYGDGFRSMRALSEQIGFQRLIGTLQTTKRLPGMTR